MKLRLPLNVTLKLILCAVFVATELGAEQLPQGFDKNSVQFIFTKIGTNYIPAGTCFAVSVPVYFKGTSWKRIVGRFVPFGSSKVGVNFPYFVTAKHVLFDERGNVRPELYWRVSKVGGGVSYTLLTPGPSNHARIITHPDESVDIAVFTIGSPEITNAVKALRQKTLPRDIKVASISSQLLKSKQFFEEHPVHEGDDMFFVGLFTPFYGSQENIPICRFGRVSMVTEEKIPFLGTSGTNIPQDLYVTETQVFGGNSGSPAFFYWSKWHRYIAIAGQPNELRHYVYFAGVVKGYFNDWSEVRVMNSVATPVSSNNVGVAVIVPAYHLYEILFSDAEKKFRMDFERLFHQKQ